MFEISDITKCKGTDCPFKDKCYRFTATPRSRRQSYYLVIPYDKKKNNCEHFYPTVKKSSIKTDN